MSSPGATLSERDYARVEASEDYSKEIVERLSDDEMRNLLILDRVKALVSQGHHRIHCVRRTMFATPTYCKHTCRCRTELRCASITADTPPEQRKHWLDMFRDTEDDEPCVLFNYGVLTTGFDAPLTSAAVISRPTKSLVLYSQMVGRVIRGTRVGGTPEAEILDRRGPEFTRIPRSFRGVQQLERCMGRLTLGLFPTDQLTVPRDSKLKMFLPGPILRPTDRMPEHIG